MSSSRCWSLSAECDAACGMRAQGFIWTIKSFYHTVVLESRMGPPMMVTPLSQVTGSRLRRSALLASAYDVRMQVTAGASC
jgi:hypothetical protein